MTAGCQPASCQATGKPARLYLGQGVEGAHDLGQLIHLASLQLVNLVQQHKVCTPAGRAQCEGLGQLPVNVYMI